jgi:hypothetical protein
MEGNTQAVGTVGWAVKKLREGVKMALPEWVETGMYLALVPGPRIVLHDAHGNVVPWDPEQGVIRRRDWVPVP